MGIPEFLTLILGLELLFVASMRKLNFKTLNKVFSGDRILKTRNCDFNQINKGLIVVPATAVTPLSFIFYFFFGSTFLLNKFKI